MTPQPPRPAGPPTGGGGVVDTVAVLADLQAQLDALQRAVQAQQATIDALTDIALDVVRAGDARR